MAINIAIDGPSASGKSTVAMEICNRLNYVHLNTGSMYRCVALAVVRNGIDYTDEKALKKLLKKIKIELKANGDVFLNGEDVTLAIRANEISMMASNVSTIGIVREKLVAMQQKMAEDKGFVMDGRDIGTVVLKDAEVKIYLTASVEARAKRRYAENLEKGIESNLSQLQNEIVERDYQDTHRLISPLKKADDAIVVDSSDMTKIEVVDAIMKIISEKL